MFDGRIHVQIVPNTISTITKGIMKIQGALSIFPVSIAIYASSGFSALIKSLITFVLEALIFGIEASKLARSDG
jgi:hypothetical protein